MKYCPTCRRKHEDSIEICDCGEDITYAKPIKKSRPVSAGRLSPKTYSDGANTFYFNPATVIWTANLIRFIAFFLLVISLISSIFGFWKIGFLAGISIIFSGFIQFALLFALDGILRTLVTISYNTRK